MQNQYIFLSLTRIAPLSDLDIEIKKLPNSDWSNGDYVLTKVTSGSAKLGIELTNGRMSLAMKNDLLIGALGVRHATLEATGTWEATAPDGHMEVLTAAGLFGKLTSKSFFVPEVIRIQYQGHLYINGKPANMKDFVSDVPVKQLTKPVILMVGTSMSAGKTTASRIITKQLNMAGLKIVGAKLTGAGRYRDILAVKDAGANAIFDFVDVGLPSSIVPADEFRDALKKLLSKIENTDADVAVIEIGASPLEPYNGDIAINALGDNIVCTVLCATDPYSVLGVMKSFDLKPTFVTGIATNTIAGNELIEKLCQVKAFNIIDPATIPILQKILGEVLVSYK